MLAAETKQELEAKFYPEALHPESMWQAVPWSLKQGGTGL
jgi:hypothetical protein